MRLAATLILLGAMVALLLSKVTSGGESRRGSSPASMSAASASTPAPIPLPAEFMGKWHPVVGSSYLARMRQEYSQSRLPGTPSFDKLVPQLKASQAAIWDFSQTEIIASFGGDEERRRDGADQRQLLEQLAETMGTPTLPKRQKSFFELLRDAVAG